MCNNVIFINITKIVKIEHDFLKGGVGECGCLKWATTHIKSYSKSLLKHRYHLAIYNILFKIRSDAEGTAFW